jgi:hypothetical protein
MKTETPLTNETILSSVKTEKTFSFVLRLPAEGCPLPCEIYRNEEKKLSAGYNEKGQFYAYYDSGRNRNGKFTTPCDIEMGTFLEAVIGLPKTIELGKATAAVGWKQILP